MLNKPAPSNIPFYPSWGYSFAEFQPAVSFTLQTVNERRMEDTIFQLADLPGIRYDPKGSLPTFLPPCFLLSSKHVLELWRLPPRLCREDLVLGRSRSVYHCFPCLWSISPVGPYPPTVWHYLVRPTHVYCPAFPLKNPSPLRAQLAESYRPPIPPSPGKERSRKTPVVSEKQMATVYSLALRHAGKKDITGTPRLADAGQGRWAQRIESESCPKGPQYTEPRTLVGPTPDTHRLRTVTPPTTIGRGLSKKKTRSKQPSGAAFIFLTLFHCFFS